MIGRERPSTCEQISQHEQINMADDYVLPRINEECDSVFADPVTEAEMLEAITGHISLNRSSMLVADSGLSSGKDDEHTDISIPHEQDHCVSQKHMVHAFDSILSSSSRHSDDEEQTTSHPDYYTAVQRTKTTINNLAGGCSSVVGQCFDHHDVIKQRDVSCEEGGMADNDQCFTSV